MAITRAKLLRERPHGASKARGNLTMRLSPTGDSARDNESAKRNISLISIGSNLTRADGVTPIDTAREAVQAMARIQGAEVCGVSRWYRTAPMPPSGQPDYVNGVVALRLRSVGPEALLANLMRIEEALGRVRSVRNAARTIDLDIISIGALIRAAPDPILPHPRAHLRAFVLMPLLDVAPGWVHPILQRPARAILEELPDQGVRLLEDQAGV
jgi:2-amino-4-hydroxy-6-hydroxymethyldihydropteridine diphosphokinase